MSDKEQKKVVKKVVTPVKPMPKEELLRKMKELGVKG